MSAALSLSQRLYGTDQAVAQPSPVRFAELDFQVQGPQLRRLRVGGVEILRSVGLVVRDAFWGTHELQPLACRTEADEQHWQQRLEGVVALAGQPPVLDWTVQMRVAAQALSVTARLQARSAFTTCRAGLMLLHPLEGVVASPVQVTHSDGQVRQGCFPDLISPGQPFFDIRQLRHSPAPGLDLEWQFDGDVFEMEDQRNWSDASFKTYNRPLAWPCPYRLEAGQVVEQSIRLRLGAAPQVRL